MRTQRSRSRGPTNGRTYYLAPPADVPLSNVKLHTWTMVYKFGDCEIPPRARSLRRVLCARACMCVRTCARERRKARGTEQNRGGSSRLPQAKAASAAGTLAAENISIGAVRSLRGPPILIRIPIFNSSEVAKISAGRKCFTRRETIPRISIAGDCLPRLPRFFFFFLFLRKRVTAFLKVPAKFRRKLLRTRALFGLAKRE